MKTLRMVLLASAFTAGTMLSASAQTGSGSQQGRPGAAGGTISAATHCLDSAGNVRLKSGAATTGAGSGSKSGAAQSPGSAGSSSGAIGGANTAAQNLPKC